MDLTSGQIKRLRAEGHRRGLKPVVTIGQHGLSDNVHGEIDTALGHHELVKLRIPALPRADKRDLAADLCRRHQATLVEMIGNVVVLYRRNGERDRFAAVISG